ncbi:MAG: chloride channel protein [Burkholderiaceae bacterium]
MKPSLQLPRALRRELSDWRIWWSRALVMGAAIAAGLTVVAFTWLTEQAFGAFGQLRAWQWWTPLFATPLVAASAVALTRRFAPGAAGSGIPQVLAALSTEVAPEQRSLFVSLRLSLAKMLLTAWGLVGGLSLGREGPSVQIAAGVMQGVARFLPRGAAVNEQGLLVAGGAAGIAAAFNAPLAGVMFAIEELSKRPEQRSSGLLVSAIVLAGLIGVSINGNATYFGVIRVPEVGLALILPGLLVALSCGVAGGLFARLLSAGLAGQPFDAPARLRQRRPVLFAALCGLAVAVIGLATQGAAFGSGYEYTHGLLAGTAGVIGLYALLKFVATWLTSWSGVPGGIFAPSLAVGAAIGQDIALLTGYPHPTTLIALGMAGFLAAATRAPLTAFIIVMEMVDGHAMVLSLMASALLASGVSRLLSPPLYHLLSELQLRRLPARAADTTAVEDESAAPGDIAEAPRPDDRSASL